MRHSQNWEVEGQVWRSQAMRILTEGRGASP